MIRIAGTNVMFRINNVEFDYFHHEYNDTKHNERCVEIPLGLYFLNKFRSDTIIEIGAVMPYYLPKIYHKVYDITDPYGYCIRDDLTKMDFSFKNYNVLSISTVEHIGTGDYELDIEEDTGVRFVKKIIDESQNYLITYPWGYNQTFDNDILDHQIDFTLIKRISNFEWIVDNSKNINDVKYNDPYLYGNSVILITNLNF